jgi:hypothetical protein
LKARAKGKAKVRVKARVRAKVRVRAKARVRVRVRARAKVNIFNKNKITNLIFHISPIIKYNRIAISIIFLSGRKIQRMFVSRIESVTYIIDVCICKIVRDICIHHFTTG